MLVNNSINIKQSSIRVLLAVVAIFGLIIWSQDDRQVYLKSTEKLLRDVSVKPPDEFQLSSDQLLKLLKPLYGITYAGDYWYNTLTKLLHSDLKILPRTGDRFLFRRRIRQELSGLIGTYSDDTICAGTQSFVQKSKRTEEKFQSFTRIYAKMTFVGIQMESIDGGFKVHQENFFPRFNLSLRHVILRISLEASPSSTALPYTLRHPHPCESLVKNHGIHIPTSAHQRHEQ